MLFFCFAVTAVYARVYVFQGHLVRRESQTEQRGASVEERNEKRIIRNSHQALAAKPSQGLYEQYLLTCSVSLFVLAIFLNLGSTSILLYLCAN